MHPEASVIDFVFSDGEGDYDNFGGEDYHSPVGAENGDPVDDVDHVGERERQLEAEQGHLDAQFAERAGAGAGVNSCPAAGSTRRSRRISRRRRW